MGKIKGSTFVKVVKSLRSQRQRALTLLPPHLHHFLTGVILPTTWHEEEDYLEMMKALAQLIEAPEGLDVWEFMGRTSAREDFEDVYKALITPGDPTTSLRAFKTHWRLRHDTGKVHIQHQAPTRAVVEIRDYALVSSEICRAVGGTLWQTLHQAGAQEIELRKELCRARGDELCRWQVGFQAADATS